MEVYNYVCKDCGSKRYKKEGNEYVCQYCGSRQVVNFEKNDEYIPKIKKTDSKENLDDFYSAEQDNAQEVKGLFKSIFKIIFNRKLFRLLVCVIFGVFGAHKFLDGKFVWGFVYIFTLGIFFVGYIVDVVIFAREYIIEIIDRIKNLSREEK